MNSANHLKRLHFRTLVCSDVSVGRRGDFIDVRPGSYPHFNSIRVTRNEGSSEEGWDRSLMEALANSLGTADESKRKWWSENRSVG